jgi:hypothetical protein
LDYQTFYQQFFSFALMQKKQKIKATSFSATNYFAPAKTFELASLQTANVSKRLYS